MDYGNFFEKEWEKRYMEMIPCEETDDECEDKEEGTLIRGFLFADRLIIWIQNYSEIAFFRQRQDQKSYPAFKLGEDVFVGKNFEVVPKLAESLYPDEVVIISDKKEIFSGKLNIGVIIDKIIKEQERLLQEDGSDVSAL